MYEYQCQTQAERTSINDVVEYLYVSKKPELAARVQGLIRHLSRLEGQLEQIYLDKQPTIVPLGEQK